MVSVSMMKTETIFGVESFAPGYKSTEFSKEKKNEESTKQNSLA